VDRATGPDRAEGGPEYSIEGRQDRSAAFAPKGGELENRSFIGHLAPKHQVNKVMLVSGDREAEVRYLAGEVGIGEVLFGKSPEEQTGDRPRRS